jgi:hypothetical protein
VSGGFASQHLHPLLRTCEVCNLGCTAQTPDKLLLLQLAALAALSSLHSLSSGMPAGLSVGCGSGQQGPVVLSP